MERASGTIHFAFGDLHSTIEDAEAHWELLLHINTTFELRVDGQVVFSEVEFPIVEFASQAAHWLRSTAVDFKYVSIESEYEPLLAFSALATGSYDFYSATEVHAKAPRPLLREELQDALRDLVQTLADECRMSLGVDVSPVLKDPHV